MTIKRKQEDSKSHFHTRHQEIGGGVALQKNKKQIENRTEK